MLKDSRKIATLVFLVLLVVIAAFALAIFRTNRLGASAQEMALQVVEESFSEDYPTPNWASRILGAYSRECGDSTYKLLSKRILCKL